MTTAFALKGLDGFMLAGTPPGPYGRWLNGAFVELLPDGRKVRLWDILSFEDSDGRVHSALPGFVSDVSSHPQFTWSWLGGPLSGKYRRSAIIHDQLLANVATDPTMTVALAHKVFRNAMLADGVSEEDADLFFTAVVGKTWWDTISPVVLFLKSAWRVVRRVIPRI